MDATKARRQTSFDKHQWPLHSPTPKQLIEAGFEYTPWKHDLIATTCPTCDLYVNNWNKIISNPYDVHLNIAPDCLWVQNHQKTKQNKPAPPVVLDHEIPANNAPSAPVTPPTTPSIPAISPPNTPPSTPPPANLPPKAPETLLFQAPLTPPPTPPTAPSTPSKPIPATPRPSRIPRPITPIPPQKPVILHQHVDAAPKKPYLTVQDLYNMFHGKPKRKSLEPIQNSLSSPPVTCHQTRITAYFKPVDGNFTKTSYKSTSFPTKHMDAKSSKCKHFETSFTSAPSAHVPANQRPRTPQISAPTPKRLKITSPALSCHSHVCRICQDCFSSNNGLHRHLRASHFHENNENSLGSYKNPWKKFS